MKRKYVFVVILTFTGIVVFSLHLLKGGIITKNTTSERFIDTSRMSTPLTASEVLPTLSKEEEEKNLLNNPIYKRFKMKPPKKKKVVNVVIGINSAPFAKFRRDGVRNTWYKECVKLDMIIPECMFFTDKVDKNSTYYKGLMEEAEKYGDLIFQNTPQGFNFAIRILYQMVYFSINYEFDYYFRIDDDYFLCMHRFLKELPYPMERNFVWSWVHCDRHIVNPDEGAIVFSRDITRAYVHQDPHRILCTAYGSTAISFWTMEIKLNYIFLHDERLNHVMTVADRPALRTTPNICQDFVGIHGALPSDMESLWKNRGENIKIIGNLKTNSKLCAYDHTFQWYKMEDITRNQSRPVPCITNPVFPGRHKSRIRLKY